LLPEPLIPMITLILLEKSGIILFFSGGGRMDFLLSVYGFKYSLILCFHKIEHLSSSLFQTLRSGMNHFSPVT